LGPGRRLQNSGKLETAEVLMSKQKTKKSSTVLNTKKRKMTVKEMLALGKRVRKSMKGPAIDHEELLYDENGLPK
jgi:hypothetical protein